MTTAFAPDFTSTTKLDAATLRAERNRDHLKNSFIVGVVWQWDHNPPTCLSCLNSYAETSGSPLTNLQQGQAHNGAAQELYQEVFSQFGEVEAVTMVAEASWTADDFAVVEANLAWQFDNNLQSMVDAMKSFNLFSANQEHRTLIRAIRQLLNGQRHNSSVMNTYRACFKANRKRLFEIVRRYVGDPA
jgi:hypothetical protein